MAGNTFINFGPKIWGGTKDPIQRKAHDSDVLSWTFGSLGRHVSVGSNAGGVVKNTSNVHEVQIAKYVDSATRQLEMASLKREPIPKCVLLVRKPDGTAAMTMTMEDCLISGWSAQGTMESFTILFDRLRT